MHSHPSIHTATATPAQISPQIDLKLALADSPIDDIASKLREKIQKQATGRKIGEDAELYQFLDDRNHA